MIVKLPTVKRINNNLMNLYVFEFSQYLNAPAVEQSFGILGDKGKRSMFGEQTGYFKRLLEKADKLGIDAFVFTDFSNTGTVGWKIKDGSWVSEKRGLPKVFYNRSFRTRKYLGGKSSTRFLTELGCIPLNSANFRKLALDKHLTYESLVNEDLGQLGLPYTEKYADDKIITFLQNRPKAILKPRFGSGGKGIISVTKNGKSYELVYEDKSITCAEDQLLDRLKSIRAKMKTSDRLYIIQEKINLPKYQNSVFDVRVIYQKGADGKPLRTGMAARLASPNRITANLHQGGKKEHLSSILETLFNQDMNGSIAESIRAYAKRLFTVLENKVGPIGEIGMDFLIDQTGKIHLIEVNSVPGRNLFKILPSIRESAIKRPVEYAKYLLSTHK